MKHTRLEGILGQRRLQFSNQAALEQYYEDKYRHGGYAAGCVRFGIDISGIYHRERHRAALRFLDPQPGQKILDAGCGDGTLAVEVASRCRELHAIDIAGNALGPKARALPNLHFAKMNVEQLAFADGTFDQVVSVETLEHVLDPHRALAELHRVLKPRGRLVITYPTINQTTVQRLQRSVLRMPPMEISEHLTEWTYDETIAAARRAGFVLDRVEGLVFDFGVLGALKSLARFLTTSLTSLSLKIRGFPRNSAFVCFAFQRVD
jgi:ubiquinone/menaquinone biosynthesis C-methylase UbiE